MSIDMQAISISADTSQFYYSYYIAGLYKVLGRRNVVYTRREVPNFEKRLAFVIPGERPRRVVVCAADNARLHDGAAAWCDLYAKVNVDPTVIPPEHASKVFPIGPSLGVRLYSAGETVLNAIRTFDWNWRHAREHFADWYRQWSYRLPEDAYVPGETRENYIYFSGTIWKNEPATNAARAMFIEACKSLAYIHFDGGFRPRNRNDVSGYEHLTVPTPNDHGQYIRKTQASAVVFNTPAVMRCHGWKLTEFLALGKAIIMTPPERLLPAPLVHGQHVHLVENPSVDSLRDAVDQICRDPDYRRRLESGARQYYLEYLQPVAVACRILAAAGGINSDAERVDPGCEIQALEKTRT